MSDENKGAPSSGEQMIPKSRLDEEIAKRNAAQQQAQFFQQSLGTLINQQRVQRGPDPEEAEIEKLKDENPLAYKLLLKQKQSERELKQVRAGFSSLADEMDKSKFYSFAGKDAGKYADKVEQIIQAERQAGNFKVDRQGAYVFLRGQEQLAKDRMPAQPLTEGAPPARQEATEEDVPSSNPHLASTMRSSQSATAVVEKSREERFKDLQDIEF